MFNLDFWISPWKGRDGKQSYRRTWGEFVRNLWLAGSEAALITQISAQAEKQQESSTHHLYQSQPHHHTDCTSSGIIQNHNCNIYFRGVYFCTCCDQGSNKERSY